MKIYITGSSGTGKSSIVKALSAKGIPAIDIDNGLCYWENKYTGEKAEWEPGSDAQWHEAHVWLCDMEQLKTFLSKHTNAVVAGVSSNQDEYLSLFDKVYILRGSQEVLLERILARTDNDFGKHPNEQERIFKGKNAFEERMIAKGAIPLDVERPLDVVVADIVSNFNSR